MRAVTVCAALLLATSVARAEPDAHVTRRSPATALWISLGTAVAGLGLVAWSVEIGVEPWNYARPPSSNTIPLQTALAATGGLAILAAPSLGRRYGRAPLWNVGSALRLAGLATAGIGLAIATTQPNGGDFGTFAAVGSLVVVGGTAFVAGTTYEIITTPGAVERSNHAHARDVSLTMTAMKTRDGATVPGLAFGGRF